MRQTKPSDFINCIKYHPCSEFKHNSQSLEEVFNARKRLKTFVTVLSTICSSRCKAHSAQVIELRMFFQLQLVQNVTLV